MRRRLARWASVPLHLRAEELDRGSELLQKHVHGPGDRGQRESGEHPQQFGCQDPAGLHTRCKYSSSVLLLKNLLIFCCYNMSSSCFLLIVNVLLQTNILTSIYIYFLQTEVKSKKSDSTLSDTFTC